MHKPKTDVNIVAEVTKEAFEVRDESANLEPAQLHFGRPQEPPSFLVYHLGDSQKPLSTRTFTTSIAGSSRLDDSRE